MMQPMPRVPPFDRPATYDDLVAIPDNLVAEIVDGELHASPRPAFPHARAHSALGVLIGGPFDHGIGGPGGWWILDEPELHLGPDVLVPDLAGWRRSRMPEVLRREGGRWLIRATHAGSDVVRATPFGEVDLDLRGLWTEPIETRRRVTGSRTIIDERRNGL
jgi:hypothetical protein